MLRQGYMSALRSLKNVPVGLRHFAAASPKPFVYQDILDIQKKPDIEWKKLTGNFKYS